MRRALFVMVLFSAGCLDPACDPAAIQAELDAAGPGDTVEIGACTVTGPLTVPAGVELRGQGESTRVVAPPDGRAVILIPGPEETALASLTVDAEGCAGIVAIGQGALAIRDVDVRATRGLGIAIDGASGLTMERTHLIGPVTAETADATPAPLPPFRCDRGDIATHGVVLVEVGSAALTDVRADGFGAFGLLALRSEVHWRGGGAAVNLGTAIEIWGGEATLEDLTLSETSDGAGAIEAYGAVFGGEATVTTRGLEVSGGDGFGLFHDHATAVHEDLVVMGQGFAGVWSQGSASIDLGGESLIRDNAFAGLAGVGATSVTVRGAAIDGTLESVRVEGVRTMRAGDGVHLVDTDALLEDLVLTDNVRTGALIDLATGSSARVALSAVTVEASGAALGAIAQNGTIAADWDVGVTRLGATAANDAAFTGTLEIAGAVGPVCFPPLDELETRGIEALLGP